MKKLLTFISILYNTFAFAQFSPEPIPSLDKSENLFDHEQQFRAWLLRQPKGTKGWKWMARYEYDLLRRIDSDGAMPSSEILLKNTKEVEKLRKTSANARVKAPEWIPAGPYGDSNLFGIG